MTELYLFEQLPNANEGDCAIASPYIRLFQAGSGGDARTRGVELLRANFEPILIAVIRGVELLRANSRSILRVVVRGVELLRANSRPILRAVVQLPRSCLTVSRELHRANFGPILKRTVGRRKMGKCKSELILKRVVAGPRGF